MMHNSLRARADAVWMYVCDCALWGDVVSACEWGGMFLAGTLVYCQNLGPELLGQNMGPELLTCFAGQDLRWRFSAAVPQADDDVRP